MWEPVNENIKLTVRKPDDENAKSWTTIYCTDIIRLQTNAHAQKRNNYNHVGVRILLLWQIQIVRNGKVINQTLKIILI